MVEVTSLPAHALRARLLARALSATELLEATLARITAVNPAVNAVVGLDAGLARAAALECDRRLGAGEARALEGLVILIKDAFDVAGLRSTAGAPAYKDRIPTIDAAPVARLRNAGAVILAKSNVPTFVSDFQSYNPVYGTTNNPWDLARTPGGSSGGAAAAVATGMAAFELASDLGGSARWPAHACGIFGLKTTWGLVPTWGHVPPPPERRTARNVDVMVAGPMARSAADLDLVLPVL
ncbi:MAG TPA: amidase family protein, partial [Beijerinckiaceae bacterium]|nr:amidase family protein [Beijerinckiaceae bacterium]